MRKEKEEREKREAEGKAGKEKTKTAEEIDQERIEKGGGGESDMSTKRVCLMKGFDLWMIIHLTRFNRISLSINFLTSCRSMVVENCCFLIFESFGVGSILLAACSVACRIRSAWTIS